MAANNILPFAQGALATVLSQAAYLAASDRINGNQPGLASQELVNKAFLQLSAVAAGVAQFIADRQGTAVDDSLTAAALATMLSAAVRENAVVSLAAGGISTAFTLTPAIPITAYEAGQTFWMTTAVAAGANPTLNISGLGATLNLVCKQADGSLVNINGNMPAGTYRVTLTSNTKALVHDLPLPSGVGSISNRNRIINGNFAINQRAVVSGVVLAAGAYGHDRWKAGAGGCTYTYATVGNDTIITITAGSLMQVIEDKNVEGGAYALQNAGTAQARIAVNGAATAGAYAAATSAAPLASAVATGSQAMTVEFTLGTVSKVQLEPGLLATPFERRSISAELAMCQRYYVGLSPATAMNIAGYGPGAGTTVYVHYGLPVPMRVVPAIVASFTALSNATAGSFRLADAKTAEGSIASAAAGNFAAVVNWTSFSAEL